MSILEQAYQELYPDNTSTRQLILKYSGRFKGYNANIRMTPSSITVNASRQWKGVSRDIQKGLLQELLVRLFKTKKQTISMELYHHFIKSLSNVAPKTHTHPVLAESFKRVNDLFFNGMMQQPNLKTGNGVNRLGTYEYATDTITISQILLENQELTDYVMYHEMLHKKHQYKAKPGRHLHHSTQFKRDEERFPNAKRLEMELNNLVKKNKKKFSWFW
jgi:hypothetical protein